VYLFRYLVSSWGRPLVCRSTRRLPAKTTPTQGLELPALRASTPVGQSCEARPTNITISFLCILPFEFASPACCLVACLRVLNDWLGYAAAGHSRFTGLLPVTWLPEPRLSEGLLPKCPPTHRCLHFEVPNLPLRELHSWASPLACSHVSSSAWHSKSFVLPTLAFPTRDQVQGVGYMRRLPHRARATHESCLSRGTSVAFFSTKIVLPIISGHMIYLCCHLLVVILAMWYYAEHKWLNEHICNFMQSGQYTLQTFFQ
jgi:hypothetical protein